MAVECANRHPPSRKIFSIASEVLGEDILDLCSNGPAEKLNSTMYAQPALLTASMALLEEWKDSFRVQNMEPPAFEAAAGLSLGEYSALCFSGALEFRDAVFLTKQRGMLMQKASELNEGGMIAVLGLEKPKVDLICKYVLEQVGGGEVCQVGNILCKGNYAVTGSSKALSKLEEIATKPPFSARKLVRLHVGGAFHSPHMQDAAKGLREALEGIEIRQPSLPVVMNVDAATHASPDVIKQRLVNQLTSPVQWEKSMGLIIGRGLSEGYEFGPGGVLTGILRKIAPHVQMTKVQ